MITLRLSLLAVGLLSACGEATPSRPEVALADAAPGLEAAPTIEAGRDEA